MSSFSTTGLEGDILKAIGEMGFETPTPIQEKTIPLLLDSEKDIIALAQTGTGKTAAFGLPAIQLTQINERFPQTLILCPTRELCLQITNDLANYSKYVKGLKVVAVYGGASAENQIRDIKKGAQIIVGTPGRTKDLMSRNRLPLNRVERVILDEADEMLTMGFKEELNAILAETPEHKQTLLFSATMSSEIKRISKKYMHDPIEVTVARVNLASENVTHQMYMVQARDRYEVLKRIADMNPNIYGIVFCRTRRETKEIAKKLMGDGYNADELHGDLSQSQRDEVMGRFRSGHLQLLIATDVAARGLDVNDLTHVINISLPDDPEVYVHRSGRTGRAGKSGISIAIINTRESRKINDIERKSGISFSKETAPTGKEICTKQLYSLIDKIVKVEVDDSQIEPFLPAIYEKLEALNREDLIKHFVSAEFNRFLMYYKNSKDIGTDSGSRKERPNRKERSNRSNTDFASVSINIGRNNDLNPARLIGVINESLRSRNSEIGRIDIQKGRTLFEIDAQLQSDVVNALKGIEFEGVKVMAKASEEKPSRSPKGEKRGGKRTRKSNFKGDSFGKWMKPNEVNFKGKKSHRKGRKNK
ncbi:MAG: DEAD/DEAH box helicase [Flavobacteriaceae bacterium]|nr:DEAD/DEAH box helicase [Flavobacteriaceae bacterium]